MKRATLRRSPGVAAAPFRYPGWGIVSTHGAVLTGALQSAARRLGLRNREVARVIGTSDASVSRLAKGRTIEPGTKEGELALLLLRLYRSLDALVGGDDGKAAAWLRAENAHVGGVPAERIQVVEGLVDVVRYLDAMRGRMRSRRSG